MNCEETARYLYRFLDRELSDAELTEVAGHLERCPQCHRYFQFHRELRLLVRRTAATERAPAHLRQSLLRLRENP